MFRRLFGRKSDDGNEAGFVPNGGVSVALTHIGGNPELEFLLLDLPEEDIVHALEGWHWIGLSGLTAIAVSAFGEVFFRAENGAILHLDAIEGRMNVVAESLSAFTADLGEAERRDDLLLAGLVVGARNRGISLATGECYDFQIAPVLGGPMDVEHMHPMSFVVKLHIAGQLHQQIKDLPPGTRINQVTISD